MNNQEYRKVNAPKDHWDPGKKEEACFLNNFKEKVDASEEVSFVLLPTLSTLLYYTQCRDSHITRDFFFNIEEQFF